METVEPRSKKPLGAPGLTTSNKKLLGAPGIATRSKDATRGYFGSKKLSMSTSPRTMCRTTIDHVTVRPRLLVSRGALELAFPAAAQGIGCSEREADWWGVWYGSNV